MDIDRIHSVMESLEPVTLDALTLVAQPTTDPEHQQKAVAQMIAYTDSCHAYVRRATALTPIPSPLPVPEFPL